MPLPQAVGHGVEELALALFPETAAVYDQKSYVQSSKVCIFFPIKMPLPKKVGARTKKKKRKKKEKNCLFIELVLNYFTFISNNYF